MPRDIGTLGFRGRRDIEAGFLEEPGLTLQQARDKRALGVALHALLEELVAGHVLGEGQGRPVPPALEWVRAARDRSRGA